MSLDRILLEGHIAAKSEGVAATPMRPAQSKVCFDHVKHVTTAAQRNSLIVNNPALNSLLTPEIERQQYQTPSPAHAIPPRFSTIIDSHARRSPRRVSASPASVDSKKVKEKDSLWEDFGTI